MAETVKDKAYYLKLADRVAYTDRELAKTYHDMAAELPEVADLATIEKVRIAEEAALASLLVGQHSRNIEKSTDRATVQRIALLAKSGQKGEAAEAMREFRLDVEAR